MCLICSNIPASPTCLEARNSPIGFSEAGDVPGTVAGAQTIALGENVFGSVGVSGDTDMYAITLNAGTYYVNMSGDEFGSNPLLDTFLSIETAGGSVLASNDDSGAGLYSFASFTLASTQTVYISAEAFSGIGDYYLQVVGADVAGSTATLGYLDESIILTGVFNSAVDQDWFEVSLTAGTTYTFSMTTSIAGDRGLVALYNGAGTIIGSQFGTFQFTATASGTFYVSAETELTSTTSGTYTIDMNIGSGGGGWDAPNLPEPLASIDWGHVVPDNNAATPTVTDINVYFAPGGQTFTDSESTYTTSAWGAAEYNAALAAFQNYENIANVNFNVVTNAAQADFFMVETTGTGALGYFNVGGGTITLGGVTYTLDGHGVFEDGGTGWNSTGGMSVGGYGYVTLIHEIGHGMGLAHPHDNGGSSSIMAGVTGPFGSIGTSGLNQGIYTTMSYNDGYYSLYGSTGPGSDNYGWQGSLMALDIAVLQDNYGANATFNNGANTYALDGGNAIGTYYQCIWDTGGTDTISFTGAAAATINLNAATLSGTAAQGAGGFLSFVAGIYGGFTIANGVRIENATGGSGADTLIGNIYGNTLNGGAGIDNMRGGAGNDFYVVDNASDRVNEAAAGSNGFDTIRSTITINLGLGFYTGDIEAVTLQGTGNINAIGSSIANVLTGNSGINILNGMVGADTLRGLGGNDTYVIDNALDVVDESAAGSGGLDRILSSVTVNLSNTAQILGSIERVELQGSANINGIGNLLANGILGNSGVNNINGLGGSDTLTGGLGNDIFQFSTALGTGASGNVDTITDFTHLGDRMWLDNAIFSSLALGALSATNLRIAGTGPLDNNDYLIYNSATGGIYYDADANGFGTAVLFAQVTAGTVITAFDFYVY